jgi:uncharacterized protein
VDLATPVEGFIEAVSTGNLLLVTGNFSTRIHAECARCSAALEMDLNFEVDEQFQVEGIPSSLSAQDYAKVVADEPFPLFDGNALAVEDLIRQDLLLAVPVQILCSFGWEGDCPIARKQVEAEPLSTQPSNALLALEAFRRLAEPGDDPLRDEEAL